MGKNLIPLIAEMLGVKIGEKFTIRQNEYIFEDYTAMFDKDKGLVHVLTDGNLENDNASLYAILSGEVEIVKLPWEPKYKEYYYSPSVSREMVIKLLWLGDTRDYAMKALGMVYRSHQEAEANLSKDYERLTGKKLSI